MPETNPKTKLGRGLRKARRASKPNRKLMKPWARKYADELAVSRLGAERKLPIPISGGHLYRARQRADLSQAELSRLLAERCEGLTPATAQVALSRLEHERQASLARDTALALFEVFYELAVELDDLALGRQVERLQLLSEGSLVADELEAAAERLAELEAAAMEAHAQAKALSHELTAIKTLLDKAGTEYDLQLEFEARLSDDEASA